MLDYEFRPCVLHVFRVGVKWMEEGEEEKGKAAFRLLHIVLENTVDTIEKALVAMLALSAF